MDKIEKMTNIVNKLIVDQTEWISGCKLKPVDGEDWNSGVVAIYNVEQFNLKVVNEMEDICRKTERVFKMLQPSMELRYYRTSFSTDGYVFNGCESGRPLI